MGQVEQLLFRRDGMAQRQFPPHLRLFGAQADPSVI